MPRQKNPRPGDPNDPDGMFVRVEQYLGSLRVRNFSERTVYHRGRQLDLFIAWCETRSLTRPDAVTKPVIEAYQRHLYHWRKVNGAPLSYGSQLQRLISVRAFFKWLARNNLLLWNPASEIDLPTLPRRLPMHVLTIEEAERVIEQPDLSDPIGVRDRAMLETLYSTGIRRMELIGLRLYDLDREHGTLRVRLGKGQKDRVVPIGERAVKWIDTYLATARPQLVFPPDTGAMFVTVDGDEINRDWLSRRVREYVASAGIEKRGSCHLFRHTCATLMLEGGADIRYIQELLGHAQVSTTQVYAHVSIRKLKAVHTLTHPGANVDRGARDAASASESTRESRDASTGAIPSLAATSGVAPPSAGANVDIEQAGTDDAASVLRAALEEEDEENDAPLDERETNARDTRVLAAIASAAKRSHSALVFLPAIASLPSLRVTSQQFTAALLRAFEAGRIELRPHSGLTPLTPTEQRPLPRAPDGSYLSYARLL